MDLKLDDFEGFGKEHIPSDYLKNIVNLKKVIRECLDNDDYQGIIEVCEYILKDYKTYKSLA